ncbi:MAG TPA: dockerin type I domain-containing protein [Anaerolineae bacterium]|nr:dockerin type I domain-containing protein [Anaerolineae bacterium]
MSGDATGNLKLTNICPGISTTDSREFRVITLGVDRLVLNQGLPSYELVTQRPTLLEHFLTRSVDLRQTDQIALDSIDLQITDLATNYTSYKTIPYNGTVPTTLGAPSAAQLLDTVNSINVPNIFLNTDAAGGTVQIKSIFKNRGYIVAQNTTTAKLETNQPVRVLFVPIMHSGYSYSDLMAMEANVDKDMNALTYRLMPQGRVQWYWSDEVRVSGSVDIGNVLKLYEAGHDMDRIRKDWNKTHSLSQVVVAFGVVDGQIASGGKDGLAFWPDLSSMLNHTALAPFEALCGLANTAVKILTFGLAGDVCNVDIPLYVGWARGDRANSSALIGHELGHISDLVKPDAINGNLFDNLTHSVNDEISNGECQSSGNVYDWSKSLYTQPGVSDPVVDPITGKQYYPQNDGNVFTPRGKAIMSYACAKNSSNVFFEPADYNTLRAGVDIYFKQNSSKLAQSLTALNLTVPTTTTIPGPRLYVSGAITQSNNTASFANIARPAGEPPLSPDFTTGYDIVQRASNGTELSRLGAYPLFTSTDEQGLEATAATTVTNDVGFFSATVLRATGVVTIELQHNGVVLAKFHAGNAVPSINLTSPTAGTYNSNVPVTWSASDADGDPLTISIEYSRDGSNWTPAGEGAGNSGTINVPTFLLGGSHTAQVRAFASDGLNVGVYTSTQFTVPNQPPLLSITAPQSGATFLEGQAIDFTGSALDKQDGVITDTQLSWRSSRDGLLGIGPELSKILSVGVHTITLQATNSAGLSATTSITLSVVGDYVMDGIPDSQKLSGSMNPLDDKLAYSDADHDGLPLIMELKWGTNPNKADSDNDGYSDAAEIAAGTDPNSAASNPGNQPPDQLVVGPTVITFTADLTDAVPFPQEPIVVASHNPVSWTLSTSTPWLTASTTNGQTPEGVTIEALPYNLGNGLYTGVINFASPQLTNTVAVTVNLTVINAARNCDVNRDGISNDADVQLVQSAIGTDYTQPNFNLRFDLNRDGTITAADVTLAQACVARQSAYMVYLPLIRK